MKISNKLLEQVLDIGVVAESKVYGSDILYTSYSKPGIAQWKSISIHEFAYLCKKYMHDGKHHIETGCYIISEGMYKGNSEWFCSLYRNTHWHANTEPEAVFMATKWFIENQEKEK